MVFVMDPVRIVNLILCTIILFLGIYGYYKRKSTVPLWIGVGFGMFGFSHLMVLLGISKSMEILLISIRTMAYLLVVISLVVFIWGKEIEIVEEE